MKRKSNPMSLPRTLHLLGLLTAMVAVAWPSIPTAHAQSEGLGKRAKPQFVLSASHGRRVDDDAASDGRSEQSRAGVFSSGREIYEWTVPKGVPRAAYRIALDVRTGGAEADPTNFVSTYSLQVLGTPGRRRTAKTEVIRFKLPSGERPRRTSDRWPVYRGRIVSTVPVVCGAGDRIRIAASAQWAQVHRVEAYRATGRFLLALQWRLDQEFHLFRRNQECRLNIDVRSWRPEPVSPVVEVSVIPPVGTRQVLLRRKITLDRDDGQTVPVVFTPRWNGPYFLEATMSLGGETWKAESFIGVVSVPAASKLPRDSLFGVHPGRLTRMYQTGFRWIRLWDSGDVWAVHERSGKGAWDFRRTREKVDTFRGQGFDILAVLAYSPAWASRHPEVDYSAGPGAPFPPKRIEDWADYCREYMERFRGQIQYYEVWNEPNTGNQNNLQKGFFRGSVEEYVALLKTAHETARRVDPNIRIVGGAGTGDFVTWTERVLAAGGGPYLDVLSFHGYTQPNPPEESDLEQRLVALRKVMAKYGIEDVPVWNTEAGYWMAARRGVHPLTNQELRAMAPPETSPNWKATWPYRPVSEDAAASWTVRHYVLNAAHGVRRLFWYSSFRSRFPLLCHDGSLRLPCLSLAAAADQLKDCHWVERVELVLSRLHLHIFEDSAGAARAALWCAGERPQTIVFPGISRESLRVFDRWGNPTDSVVKRSSEGIRIEVGENPIWLHAPRSWLQQARLAASDVVIPVTDCFVVNEVNPKRPVKEHTSRPHHGNRRVFGLPDRGDALGWRLRGIEPGLYDIEIELRTGLRESPWSCLPWYEVAVVTRAGKTPLRLEPSQSRQRQPEIVPGERGGGRVYGWARADRPVRLKSGDEIHVVLRKGFGLVGGLHLRKRQ